MGTFFPSENPFVGMDSTTRVDHALPNPPPTATSSKPYERATTSTSRALDKAASVAILDGRHQLQALYDFGKAANVVWNRGSLLRHCVARQDDRQIAETKPLKLSNVASRVISTVRRDFSPAAIVEFIVKFSVALEEVRRVSVLAVWIVDNAENMVLCNFSDRQ